MRVCIYPSVCFAIELFCCLFARLFIYAGSHKNGNSNNNLESQWRVILGLLSINSGLRRGIVVFDFEQLCLPGRTLHVVSCRTSLEQAGYNQRTKHADGSEAQQLADSSDYYL